MPVSQLLPGRHVILIPYHIVSSVHVYYLYFDKFLFIYINIDIISISYRYCDILHISYRYSRPLSNLKSDIDPSLVKRITPNVIKRLTNFSRVITVLTLLTVLKVTTVSTLFTVCIRG